MPKGALGVLMFPQQGLDPSVLVLNEHKELQYPKTGSASSASYVLGEGMGWICCFPFSFWTISGAAHCRMG